MATIKHIAISSQDPEATAGFYAKVFGLKEVGKIDTENTEGYYLTDGHINFAILKFKNDVVAGEEFGAGFSGIHHIGFQVDDPGTTHARLQEADSPPRTEINERLQGGMGKGHGGRNMELKYSGPDGVIIEISQNGWVGTNGRL